MRQPMISVPTIALAGGLLSAGLPLSATAEETLTLEEVLVTAQRRTQSLQDVPISIIAMDQQTLEMRGIDEIEDISLDIPNFTVNTFPADSTTIRLFIRGIGQNDAQITQDPSVALYLDGVYIGTSVAAGFEGVDVERIEVLRGPQGTLYGRNATGGAVNIITRRASVERVEFRQDITVGNLDKFQSKTMLNLPLGKTVAAKLNYNYTQRDGIVENEGPGEDFMNEDRQTLVADLRWLAGDEVTVDYRFENARIKDSEPFNQVLTDPALSNGIVAAVINYNDDWAPDRLDKVTSQRPILSSDQEITAHSLWLQWEINDKLRLQSISAYRDLDSFSPSDFLPTGITLGGDAPVLGRFYTTFEQWSQELQLQANTEHWEFVTGLYYYQDEAFQDNFEGATLGTCCLTNTTDTENWSAAAYTQVTWNPAWMEQSWHLTLGGRYAYDERKSERDNQSSVSSFVGFYEEDFSNFNPSLVVAYDINDDMNLYGKIETGYKSGGTSQRSARGDLFAQGFDEEEIISYELGFKGEFWSGRGRYNSALFYMEIDGLQSSIQTDPVSPGGRDFLPSDNNQVLGAEVDLNLLLTQGLTLTLSYGYLDTELGESALTTDLGLSETLSEDLPYAPDHSFYSALDYTRTMGPGTLSVNLNYGWQEDVGTSVTDNGNFVVDAYGLLGAAVSWSELSLNNMSGSFQLLLWGRNLLDEEFGLSGQTALEPLGADETQIFGEPRTYGVTVTYRY
ncbi:MAG: iron complex outermembrane receptor protein [Halioglobus sp.]|jgi:iron complex outermembrane receptor protein